MGFLKLLLNIGLLLILAISTDFCIADSKIMYRLPKTILPVHYNISLMTHLEEGIFYGEINVNIVNFYEGSKIILHSQDLEINETATTLINNGTISKPVEHVYDNVTNMLTLNFDKVLLLGRYTLNMKFAGNFSETGFLQNGFLKVPRTDEERDNTLAVTFFEPNKARRVFPCWDEPEWKTTFNISVLHHQKYRVVSNMPIREQYANEDGLVWTHFDITPAMSTYLVGIVIFNHVHITNEDESVNVWCRSSLTPQASFAHDIAEFVAPLLVEYTNSSQKIPKMDHVLIHDYPVYGMENWGLIIYNESNVLFDESTDPSFKRKDVASLVAHELVHQWFGNLVTPIWWSHLWLSEGFATFFQAYFLDKINEDWRTMDFLVVQNLHESLTLDIGLMVPMTLELDHTFDYGDLFINEIYDKAPVILRMLHHSITDEIFRKGVMTYLARHQFASVVPDDLWSAMQSALNEQYYIPHEDFTVKDVMDSWIKQNRYPVLNVTRNYETGEVAIKQQCFYTVKECTNNTEWWIPITFATQSNPDFTRTVPNHWLGPEQTSSFEIYSSDWIIVNVQQTAYCRVYYDAANWRKIISYLNSDQYTKIHVLNRAQIIDDAFAFFLQNQIHTSLFLNLTSYLSRELDYVAWYPMFRILKRISQYFSLPEKEHFKIHMLQIFEVLLRIIGYQENSSDDDMMKMLRLEAAKWACTLGDTECKRIAAAKLNKHLADPDNHKIPQWWQEWTYYFGLSKANRTTWDQVLGLYIQNPDKQFWKILNGAEDPHIIIDYLNIIASNTAYFRAEDHPFIFKIVLEKHARNDVILDYILQNFEIIKPRSVDSDIIIKNILWNIFTENQLNKVKQFSEIHFYQNQDTLFKIHDLIEKRKSSLKRAVDIYIKRFKTN